jgi:hypothetical protein
MKPDPTIDAIREVRHQISLSVNHDARKLVERYRQLQERHSGRVVHSPDAGMLKSDLQLDIPGMPLANPMTCDDIIRGVQGGRKS